MNKQLAAERTRMYKVMREAHPLYFGDPLKFNDGPAHSGVAYGEYNKSGGGFLGAVISVGLAVATGGASLGFTTIASTLSTVALIGTVVGGVTGNKAFLTIGAIAGLGSSFMSLAGNGTLGADLKGWSESANQNWSSFTGQSASANISPTATAAATDTVTAPGAPEAATEGGIINSANNSVDSATGNLNLSDTPAVQPAGNEIGIDAIEAGSPAAAEGGITIGSEATNLNDIASPSTAAENMKKWGIGDAAADPTSSQMTKIGDATISTGIFDMIGTFAKQNKELLELTGKLGVGLFTDDSSKNAAYDAQARSSDASASLYNAKTAEMAQQATNANSIPDVRSMYSANPNAQIYKKPPTYAAATRPGGLIQQRSA